MQLEEKHYMVSPEIYESYRNEKRVSETAGSSFRMLNYHQGRRELWYRECVHIELPEVASLTHYKNGDYKLTNG
jgi:hypothetical protein